MTWDVYFDETPLETFRKSLNLLMKEGSEEVDRLKRSFEYGPSRVKLTQLRWARKTFLEIY
ncbi:4827_t:CDS:2, partial [Ambispora gerdemannii]